MLAVLMLSTTACGENQEGHHTIYIMVNAKNVEISRLVEGTVVKPLVAYISCESPETCFLHVDFALGEITDLEFKDLAVGDEITLDLESMKNKYALTSRVQVLNQEKMKVFFCSLQF